jgi:RNA-directed DNA polymerase
VTSQPHLNWANIFDGAGVPLADAMMARSEYLRPAGAPVIYSLKHLALTTDVSYGFLLGVIRRTAPAYRAIRIPKNTGGFRDLLSPSESLMRVQRWILHEILIHLPRHINNFAYFRKITPKDCADRHAGANWMIKSDLHNYFPSIGVVLGTRTCFRLNWRDYVLGRALKLLQWQRTPGGQV